MKRLLYMNPFFENPTKKGCNDYHFQAPGDLFSSPPKKDIQAHDLYKHPRNSRRCVCWTDRDKNPDCYFEGEIDDLELMIYSAVPIQK